MMATKTAASIGSKRACAVLRATCAPRGLRPVVCVSAETSSGAELVCDRRTVLGTGALLAGASVVELSSPSPSLAEVVSSDWEVVKLPVEDGVILQDIVFTGSDPRHGFLIGSRQTMLETFDGGRTWEVRNIDATRDEGFNYRFNSIAFSGDEGWIVGKPAILLHTVDGGKNWERVPLSAKLPGTPILISAGRKAGEAEMTTDQGAIYATDNAGYSWSAAVQETVDATLNRTVSSGINGASYYEGYFSNVQRNPAGDYVAVSSRGNFFMSWEGGQTYWQPHNRPAARRIQNMGWTPDSKLWLTTRGGDLLFAREGGITESFDNSSLNSRGFGILDVGFKDGKTAFACGGSGSLFKSTDGGLSWKRDKGGDGVPANLYAIKFFDNNQGFVLGNDAVLLRYIGA